MIWLPTCTENTFYVGFCFIPKCSLVQNTEEGVGKSISLKVLTTKVHCPG